MRLCPLLRLLPPPLQFFRVPVPQHLAGRRFLDVVEWLFCTSQGVVLIGE